MLQSESVDLVLGTNENRSRYGLPDIDMKGRMKGEILENVVNPLGNTRRTDHYKGLRSIALGHCHEKARNA
jgi:hypothetical protein